MYFCPTIIDYCNTNEAIALYYTCRMARDAVTEYRPIADHLRRVWMNGIGFIAAKGARIYDLFHPETTDEHARIGIMEIFCAPEKGQYALVRSYHENRFVPVVLSSVSVAPSSTDRETSSTDRKTSRVFFIVATDVAIDMFRARKRGYAAIRVDDLPRIAPKKDGDDDDIAADLLQVAGHSVDNVSSKGDDEDERGKHEDEVGGDESLGRDE